MDKFIDTSCINMLIQRYSGVSNAQSRQGITVEYCNRIAKRCPGPLHAQTEQWTRGSTDVATRITVGDVSAAIV